MSRVEFGYGKMIVRNRIEKRIREGGSPRQHHSNDVSQEPCYRICNSCFKTKFLIAGRNKEKKFCDACIENSPDSRCMKCDGIFKDTSALRGHAAYDTCAPCKFGRNK